jgi:hypothetical protein
VFSFTASIRIHALTASSKFALVRTLRCSSTSISELRSTRCACLSSHAVALR